EDRLAGLGRRDDQAALALADGDEQVHEAHRESARRVLETDAVLGVARSQVVEGGAELRMLRDVGVNLLDLVYREVALSLFRRTDLDHDGVAGAQVEALDLGRADVDVVGAVQVVPVLRAQEAVAFGEDLEHAFTAQHYVAVEKVLFDTEDEILF